MLRIEVRCIRYMSMLVSLFCIVWVVLGWCVVFFDCFLFIYWKILLSLLILLVRVMIRFFGEWNWV